MASLAYDNQYSPPAETDFYRIVHEEVAEFVATTRLFKSEVMDNMAKLVKEAFEAELSLIVPGMTGPEPDSDTLARFTEPAYSILRKIQEHRESNRNVTEFSNHLATIAESVMALSWITYPKTPLQYIRDMKEAGDYYGNRVLTANKGKEVHVTWINKWNAVFAALEEYVKKYHRTGFAWNSLTLKGSASVPAPPGHPAPPPPPALPTISSSSDVHSGPFLQQELLRQLNQGTDIVKMLKKPPKETDQASKPPVSPARSTGSPSAQKGSPSAPAHPPVFVLEGKKWRVEYCSRGNPMEVKPNDKSETLSVYKCDNIALSATGKMNAVTIDCCKRARIMLSDIIASVEMIRCESVELHCMGSCRNITLDNCDSVSIYLVDCSLNCEIITAKCTSTNVCRVLENGEIVEFPVPEQIRSVLVNGKLQSSVVEHCM